MDSVAAQGITQSKETESGFEKNSDKITGILREHCQYCARAFIRSASGSWYLPALDIHDQEAIC